MVSISFLSVVLGMGAAGYLLLHGGRGRRLVLVSLGVIAVGVLFCGSRGPLILSVVSAGVMSLAFLWGAPWRNRQVYRVLKATRHSVIVMGICLALAALILPEEVGKRWNFYSETLSPSSSAYELSYSDLGLSSFTNSCLPSRDLTGPWGTARAQLRWVCNTLRNFWERGRHNSRVESGFGSLLAEFGIAGPILWLIWTTALVISCWRVVLKLRQTRMFPLGFAAFWFAFVLLFPRNVRFT